MAIKKVIIIIFIVNLLSCSSDRPLSKEQVLSQSIDAIETRFESRNLSDIVEYVSESYQDERGRTIRDIKRTIQIQIMRHKSLYVLKSIGDVEWHDNENVSVQIAAAMAGKPIESVNLLKSIRADMINFNVDFVLEEDKFKVKSASWRWAKPQDFF
ncbi:MAG: hypothetical protein AB8B80_07100 [Marinicellaceae bacterium]